MPIFIDCVDFWRLLVILDKSGRTLGGAMILTFNFGAVLLLFLLVIDEVDGIGGNCEWRMGFFEEFRGDGCEGEVVAGH